MLKEIGDEWYQNWVIELRSGDVIELADGTRWRVVSRSLYEADLIKGAEKKTITMNAPFKLIEAVEREKLEPSRRTKARRRY